MLTVKWNKLKNKKARLGRYDDNKMLRQFQFWIVDVVNEKIR